ncbi:MAG: DUF2490 domain-containing protein [Deltaproteobacteria bacterium]|nr:DUF2490 domain-containing protein [Deltaproteobacteria bacterium]
MKLKITLISLFVLLLPFSSYAETQDETSFWLTHLSKFKFENNWRAFTDLQLRYRSDDADDKSEKRTQQFLTRGALGYQFSPAFSFYQGFAILSNLGPKRIEQRSFQQLSYKHSIDQYLIGHRIRLEQRFMEKVYDVSHRARYAFDFISPLIPQEDISIEVSEEVFFNLNDADNGPQTGFAQNRLFVGPIFKVSDSMSLKVGYLNQFSDRHARSNTSNHVLNFAISNSFDFS